ncbi:hypothetical protein [Schlesneria sp. T3-172]|uniref:hypothetical protein n=1 Tax=Schlesneria sphaerica TaxID=3373610 RepID=UPI0037C9147F
MRTTLRVCGLLLVLAGLAWLLWYQKKAEFAEQRITLEQERLKFTPPQIEVDGIQFGVSIDALSVQPLADAIAARPAVDDLLEKRRKEIVWPDLIVPMKVNMRTTADFKKDYLRYRLRELDSYRRITKDADVARLAGEVFVEAYVRATGGFHEENVDYKDLLKLGQAAIDAGAADPLLRTYYACVKWVAKGDKLESERIWNEVVSELPSTDYLKTVQVYARCLLHDAAEPTDIANSTNRWQHAVAAIVQWLEEDAANPEFLESVCHRLINLWDNASLERREMLLGGVLQSKKIHPYVVHLLTGQYFATRALHLMQGEYIESGIDPDSKSVVLHRKAVDHLKYAWHLHPELPYAPQSLVAISRSKTLPGDTPYFWFLQSIEARFDYYPAYESLLNSLHPRWGGRYESMLLFANNCVNTDRFQTFVPFFVINVLTDLSKLEDWSLKEHPEAIKLLHHLVAARNTCHKEHPQEVLRDTFTNYSALIILQLEDCKLFELAADYIPAVLEGINWTLLQEESRPGRYLTARLRAAQGELLKPILDFDEKLRTPFEASNGPESIAELESQYKELRDSAFQQNPAAADYFRHAETILKQLRQFSSGELVPLTIDSQLSGWEPYCDNYTVTEENHVMLSGRWSMTGQISLRPLASFRPPLEFEGRLEILEPEPYPSDAGVGWSREGMKSETDLYSSLLPHFTIKPSKFATYPSTERLRHDYAQIVVGSTPRIGMFPLSSTKSHHLRVKLWPKVAEYRVDDEVLLSINLPEELPPDGWLCLGENSPLSSRARRLSNGAMEWSQLQVRRLDTGSPPLPEVSLEQRVAYWENRYADDSEDAAALLGLCSVRFEQGKDEAVLALADEALAKWPRINGFSYWKALVFFDHLRDYKAAAEQFKIVLSEPRDIPDALSRYVEILAIGPDDSLRNLDSARQSAEMNVRLTQQPHGRALAALAAVYAELGDFDQAIQHQEAALKVSDETLRLDWEERLRKYQSRERYRLPIRSNPAGEM